MTKGVLKETPSAMAAGVRSCVQTPMSCGPKHDLVSLSRCLS